MTILKYDNVIKKVTCTWLLFWYFFVGSYVVPHSCKVLNPELNWFRIYDRGSFRKAT